MKKIFIRLEIWMLQLEIKYAKRKWKNLRKRWSALYSHMTFLISEDNEIKPIQEKIDRLKLQLA